MIIVDFSHLSRRNLHVAISKSRPRKEGGIYVTSEYIQFYYHLMLASLRHIQKKFTKEYGNIILAIDSKKNWRKSIYKEYKYRRKNSRKKSEINFEEFFDYQNKFIKELESYFPYKVLEVEYTEADDIIGILSIYKGKQEKVLVISSDKDMKQILSYGAKLYDPIKLKMITMTDDELKKWKLTHILLGDDGDDIPNILQGTEFSSNFISYLKKNDIYIDDPYTFGKMSISEKLINDYDIYKTNKKGEKLETKDIFKTPRFGPVAAEKFAQNLQENLKNSPLLMQNFKRNKTLVLFSEIPQDIVNNVLEKFDSLEITYDCNEILNFLMKNNLTQHLNNISDFYIVPNTTNTSSLDWV